MAPSLYEDPFTGQSPHTSRMRHRYAPPTVCPQVQQGGFSSFGCVQVQNESCDYESIHMARDTQISCVWKVLEVTPEDVQWKCPLE
jgi:hypothetical protein